MQLLWSSKHSARPYFQRSAIIACQLRQKARVNRISTEKISSRPSSIVKVQTQVALLHKSAASRRW
ncbi:hypothetical protein ABHF33_03845 [Chitinibacter sp. FCG-7]|uniref:Uncharacterized protein n=1 Tax=Chitinibacter mangrovi TaxID=3153927 RepID=A0AAU7FCL9_9NEIS